MRYKQLAFFREYFDELKIARKYLMSCYPDEFVSWFERQEKLKVGYWWTFGGNSGNFLHGWKDQLIKKSLEN